MSSFIKILRQTKIELDKLQAEILIKYGKKLTQQEILDILVQFGKDHYYKYFLEQELNEDPQLRKNKYKAILKKSKNWGVRTQEEMIDEVLYGENQE